MDYLQSADLYIKYLLRIISEQTLGLSSPLNWMLSLYIAKSNTSDLDIFTNSFTKYKEIYLIK